MAEKTSITRFADLRLSVEDRESAAQLAGDMIAVNVYRELQRASDLAKASSSGCNIIGNCSSSCKNDLLANK